MDTTVPSVRSGERTDVHGSTGVANDEVSTQPASTQPLVNSLLGHTPAANASSDTESTSSSSTAGLRIQHDGSQSAAEHDEDPISGGPTLAFDITTAELDGQSVHLVISNDDGTSHDSLLENPPSSPGGNEGHRTMFDHQALNDNAGSDNANNDSIIQHVYLNPQPLSCQEQSENATNTQQISASLKTWRPLPVTRPALLAFASLFLFMIVGLEILNYFSHRNQGLVTVSMDRYYLWKFGPTTLLTIVITFWIQVEYRSKQMMPWILMAGSQHGSNGMKGFTLNYLTSSTPGSLYRALTDGHFPVVLGMLGTLLFRLLIICSTNLLNAEDRVVTHQENVLILDRFNVSKDVTSADLDVNPVDDLVTLWAIGNSNLPYPQGTTPKLATQSFAMPDAVTPGRISVEVDAFSASLEDCKLSSRIVPEAEFGALADSVTQEFYESLSSYCVDEMDPSHGSPVMNVEGAAVMGIKCLQKCSGSKSEKDSQRLLMVFPLSLSDPELEIRSAISCRPKYSLSRRIASSAISGSAFDRVLEVSDNIIESLHLEIPPINLTRSFASDIRTFTNFYEVLFKLTDPSAADTLTNPEYYPYSVPLNWTMPQANVTRFSEPGILSEAFQRLFQSYMAQFFKTHHFSPLDQKTTGMLISTEKRLCVGELPLRLMESLLTMLSIISLCMCFVTFPRFSMDPASLATHALLLARSPGLHPLLQGTGALLKKPFKRLLSGYTLEATAHRGSGKGAVYTCINISGSQLEAPDTVTDHALEPSDQPKWWQPMASTWKFRIVIATVTIGLVIALEVLCQYSARNKGILGLSEDSRQRYGWLYVPASVMAGTALAYSVLDSTSRALHPFQVLLAGNMGFQELFFEPLGEPTLFAAFYAIRKRYFALTAILITSFLGPTLTIVTSGLFIADTVPYGDRVPLHPQDWFSIGDDKPLSCKLPSQITSEAIQFNNLSYPRWTFDDYVFPVISLDTVQSNVKPDAASSITARIPALRSDINCTLQAFYTASNLTFSEDDLTGTQLIEASPPSGCDRQENLHLWCGSLGSDSGIGGCEAHSYQFGTGRESLPPDTKPCNDDRAHFWFMTMAGKEYQMDEVSLLHCMPYVEALHTTVNFTLPDLAIDATTTPPKPDDQSPPPRPFSNFATEMGESCMGTISANVYSTREASLDSFFKALTLGRDGVPMAELVGLANADRLVRRMNRVYGQIMAQEINANYRVPLSPAGADAGNLTAVDMLDALSGTVVVGRLRLVQSPVATRILEGVLLAMVVCAGLHFWLGRETRILPKDPGSVAAKMSLFAGSKVIQRVPENLEELRDTFRREVVSLGWWDGVEEEGARSGIGERRRFGIDVGVAETD